MQIKVQIKWPRMQIKVQIKWQDANNDVNKLKDLALFMLYLLAF